jgi:hypothetical protein
MRRISDIVLRVCGLGVLLQASCSFDTDAFINSSVASWSNGVTSSFINSVLSDILNVETGGFF